MYYIFNFREIHRFLFAFLRTYRYTPFDLGEELEGFLTCDDFVSAKRKRTSEPYVLLDPCSCSDSHAFASELSGHSISGANLRFSQQVCAFQNEWKADALYLNPPSSRYGNARFTARLLQQLDAGNFRVALVLVPAFTSSIWLRDLLHHDCCVAYIPLTRLRFIRGVGRQGEGSDPCDRILAFLDRVQATRTRGEAEHIAAAVAFARRFAKFASARAHIVVV